MIDRESKLTLGAMAALFGVAIVWGWSKGAFASPSAPTPKVPVPPPDPGRLPAPAPAPLEPFVGVLPADVPPEIVQGGVPLEGGWATHAWYSYRGRWIRVDVHPDADSTPGHPHGLYRWVVVAGDATPLATWSTASLDVFGQVVTFTDDNTDWIAGKAAEWIDALLDVGA